MHAGRAGSSGNLQAELNITPLIDVMLVLLIIFMVAMPAMTRSIGFRLPLSAPPVDAVRPEPVRLHLANDGRVALDGRDMSRAQLDYALRQHALQQPPPLLMITAADGARYQDVAGLMAGARSAGLGGIALEP